MPRILRLCDAAIGDVVNIGSNSEISINDIVKKIQEIMGSNLKIVIDKQRIRNESSEVFRLFCDNQKIKYLTGYEPKINIDKGLKKTIDWILEPNHLITYKSEIFNV